MWAAQDFSSPKLALGRARKGVRIVTFPEGRSEFSFVPCSVVGLEIGRFVWFRRKQNQRINQSEKELWVPGWTSCWCGRKDLGFYPDGHGLDSLLSHGLAESDVVHLVWTCPLSLFVHKGRAVSHHGEGGWDGSGG